VILSNVSGARSKIKFADKIVHRLSAFGPYIPPASCLIVCHTYAFSTRMHVTMENNLPFTAKQLCERMNQILEESIKTHN